MDKSNMSLGDIIKMEKNSEKQDAALKKSRRSRNTSHQGTQINTSSALVVAQRKPNAPSAGLRSFCFGNRHMANRSTPQVQPSNVPWSSSKSINISNVAPSVSDADLMQLFSEFGQIISAAIHYDIQGRHLGSASVIFARESDAVRAIGKYNGVGLDGSIMRMQFDASENIKRTDLQVPSASLAMRLSHPNSIMMPMHTSTYNPPQVMLLSPPNNIMMPMHTSTYNPPQVMPYEGTRPLESSNSFVIEKNNQSKGGSGHVKQKRKRIDEEPERSPDQLDEELDEYMGTAKWIRNEKTKKVKQDVTRFNKTKKMDLTKKCKISSILKPDERESQSDNSDNDLAKQEDLDRELDAYIAKDKKLPSRPTNETAEKVQKKLMNLI